MIPKVQFGLGVDHRGVYMYYVPDVDAPKITRIITSVEDFVSFVKERASDVPCDPDDLLIVCSSEMDFPHEYNKDPEVIKLANTIRG